jgi:hypothetical protein
MKSCDDWVGVSISFFIISLAINFQRDYKALTIRQYPYRPMRLYLYNAITDLLTSINNELSKPPATRPRTLF